MLDFGQDFLFSLNAKGPSLLKTDIDRITSHLETVSHPLHDNKRLDISNHRRFLLFLLGCLKFGITYMAQNASPFSLTFEYAPFALIAALWFYYGSYDFHDARTLQLTGRCICSTYQLSLYSNHAGEKLITPLEKV